MFVSIALDSSRLSIVSVGVNGDREASNKDECWAIWGEDNVPAPDVAQTMYLSRDYHSDAMSFTLILHFVSIGGGIPHQMSCDHSSLTVSFSIMYEPSTTP